MGPRSPDMAIPAFTAQVVMAERFETGWTSQYVHAAISAWPGHAGPLSQQLQKG